MSSVALGNGGSINDMVPQVSAGALRAHLKEM